MTALTGGLRDARAEQPPRTSIRPWGTRGPPPTRGLRGAHSRQHARTSFCLRGAREPAPTAARPGARPVQSSPLCRTSTEVVPELPSQGLFDSAYHHLGHARRARRRVRPARPRDLPPRQRLLASRRHDLRPGRRPAPAGGTAGWHGARHRLQKLRGEPVRPGARGGGAAGRGARARAAVLLAFVVLVASCLGAAAAKGTGCDGQCGGCKKKKCKFDDRCFYDPAANFCQDVGRPAVHSRIHSLPT